MQRLGRLRLPGAEGWQCRAHRGERADYAEDGTLEVYEAAESWTCVWRAPGRGAAAISALAWTHLGSRRGRLLSAGMCAPLPPPTRTTRDDAVVVPLSLPSLLRARTLHHAHTDGEERAVLASREHPNKGIVSMLWGMLSTRRVREEWRLASQQLPFAP